MKTVSAIVLGAFLLSIPNFSFAHGDKIKTVKGIFPMALAVFENDEQESVRNKFVGAKAWVDGADLWVKVLLAGQEMILYECVIDRWEHEEGTQDVPIGSCTKNENPSGGGDGHGDHKH